MPSTDTNKNVIGLTNDVTHQFRVAAKTDAVGEWSNVASARPWAPRLMAMIFDGYFTGAQSPTVFEQNGNTFTPVAAATSFPTTAVASAGSADGGGRAMAISSYLDYFAVIDSGALVVYSRNGQAFTPLPPLPSAPASPTAVDMQGDYLVVGTSDSGAPLAVYSRSGSTFTRLADLNGLPSSPVTCVSLSADGGYLVALSNNNQVNATYTISVYARNGSTFSKLTDAIAPATFIEVTGARFSPNGDYLVVNTYSLGAKVYARTGSTFTDISPSYQPMYLGSGRPRIAFSPNSTIFAAENNGGYGYNGGQSGAVVYAIVNGATTMIYDSLPAEACQGLAFSADGSLLAAGFSGTIRFYSVSGTTVTPLPNSTVSLQTGAHYATDLEFSWPAT